MSFVLGSDSWECLRLGEDAVECGSVAAPKIPPQNPTSNSKVAFPLLENVCAFVPISYGNYMGMGAHRGHRARLGAKWPQHDSTTVSSPISRRQSKQHGMSLEHNDISQQRTKDNCGNANMRRYIGANRTGIRKANRNPASRIVDLFRI